MGTGGTFPEEMQSGHETDHSPPFNAEVKNDSSYTFFPPYTSMACKGTFTFTFRNFTNRMSDQRNYKNNDFSLNC
jgi:hypothetical protein